MDAEGAVTQVTRVDYGPGAVAWSPDGKWLAFTMLVPEAGSLNSTVPGKPAGATWVAEPKVVERLDYRQDYNGYSDAGHSQLFVVPSERGHAAPADRGSLESFGTGVDDRRQGAPLLEPSSKGRRVRVAGDRDLRGERGERRDPPDHPPEGSRFWPPR
jgi:dipeptidyl aminopeptidase/acylaminoacyl peptidase